MYLKIYISALQTMDWMADGLGWMDFDRLDPDRASNNISLQPSFYS